MFARTPRLLLRPGFPEDAPALAAAIADLAIVRNLCERVVVMYHGEIVEEGLSQEVFSRPKHPYTAALIAAIPDIDPDRPLLGGSGLGEDMPSMPAQPAKRIP